MKLYIVKRYDEVDWDECAEQTILARDEVEALELANRLYGSWYIDEIVDMTKSS